jgi:hypothetical protein
VGIQMAGNLTALTFRIDELGVKRYTFDPSAVRQFVKENPDSDAIIRDDRGSVLGLVRTELLMECLEQESPAV